ncbi:uncharacterized protein LOC62_02G002958 [Vanrija pseudolonga]|uniref:Uncharacterized protein n=1 Tax=Vanrija pseudolonga TaxID=143232 RepID=A0AAF1BGX5_9TREE|nr:hypothetical protein LOC62_02G002958 [Vanrija pseudolonga]
MSTTAFSGALSQKRKGEIVEIAQALSIDTTDGKLVELRERVQEKLDTESDSLKADPRFKGLYQRRPRTQASDSDPGAETPGPEAKTPASRVRKSINKTLEKIVDAANIPLPDSPLSVSKSKAKAAADQALTLVENDADDALAVIKTYTKSVVKFVDGRKVAVEGVVREAREILSTPHGILAAAIGIEEAFLYHSVTPFNRYTVVFPPSTTDRGSIAQLLRTVFFWFPRVSWTYWLPTLHSFGRDSDFWPALAWWFFATILPPLALSTVVSFVPQKGVHRGGATTRYQAANPPSPTIDALTFALFRLAILLVPLTSAAPTTLVDALEQSGNSQARALGAGLVAALLLAERLATGYKA